MKVTILFMFITHCIIVSLLFFESTEAQLPACRNQAVNDVTFDVDIKVEFVAKKPFSLFADVSWTVNNPRGATLDGFAVHFSDTEATRNHTVASRSIPPVGVCHSGEAHLWVITANQSGCDTSRTTPSCAQNVQLQDACLCPQANCALFNPSQCKSALVLFGPEYNYHLSVLPTTRSLRFPILFDTAYEFSITPYYREFANLSPKKAALSPVDECNDVVTQKLGRNLTAVACLYFSWSPPATPVDHYEVQIQNVGSGGGSKVRTIVTNATSADVCDLDACGEYVVVIYGSTGGVLLNLTEPENYITNMTIDLVEPVLNPTTPSTPLPTTTPVVDTTREVSICDSNPCPANSTCIVGSELYECLCKEGFSGDGLNCVDSDECSSNPCSPNATCTNTIGSFGCVCDQGLEGDGFSCTDMEFCKSITCSTNSKCVGTPVDFSCKCNEGYTGDPCVDINECDASPRLCHINTTCANNDGSYRCICNSGLSGNGTSCTDIDECATGSHNCDPMALCEDNFGSFSCKCRSGFEGNGTLCRDIDECQDPARYACNTTEKACRNTAGSYTCDCANGFEQNGTGCQDIDECTTGSDNCDPMASCYNNVGSFSCECLSGYEGNGASCTDIDECISGNHDCGEYETCFNSPASFSCKCKFGFEGNGTVCGVSPYDCSKTQRIESLNFPPVQPGLVSYSSEMCQDENTVTTTPLASIRCDINPVTTLPRYNLSTLGYTNCSETIRILTSPPYTNIDVKLKALQSLTESTTQLQEEDVGQVTVFFETIAIQKQFNEEEVQDVAEITSHLSQYYGQEKIALTDSGSEKQSVVKSVTEIARKLDLDGTSAFTALSNDINIGVKDVADLNEPYKFSAQFYSNNVTDDIFIPIEISIPSKALENAATLLDTGSSVRAVSVGYRNSFLFPSEKTAEWVISTSLGDQNTTLEDVTLAEPATITNNQIQDRPGVVSLGDFKDELTKVECVFWNFNSSSWSREGCTLVKTSPITCECNHLTNFAVLVSKKEIPANYALSVVSYFGCGLSVICLIMTIIVVSLRKNLRRKYPNQIMINLCGCLAMSFLLFIFGVGSATNKAGCSALTAFLHYFWLTTWFWMAAYSQNVYRDVVKVISSYGKSRSLLAACAVSYGAPLIIVVLNAGIALGHIDRNMEDDPFLESSYKARNFCWLRHYSLYFGFLLPVGILLVYNIVVFCIVIPKITCKRAQIQSTASKQGAKAHVVISVVVATTMGLSWVFGYLMLIADDVTYLTVMSWFFAIFNAFQGAFIFFFSVVRTGELMKLFRKEESKTLSTDGRVDSTGLARTSAPASPTSTSPPVSPTRTGLSPSPAHNNSFTYPADTM